MNASSIPNSWTLADFAALSPLLLLAVTALAVLLISAFARESQQHKTAPLTLVGLLTALLATGLFPGSSNELLTPWIAFDGISQFFTIAFLLVAIAVLLLSETSFQQQELEGKPLPRSEFFFLLLAATAGAILLASAADFLLLFLGLETLSLALYVLCNYVKRSPEANESAIKYFLMGSLAAAFLLYGIALVYGALGTTNVAIFHRGYEYLTTPTAHALFLGGVALITLGIAFKVALVPFHSWAPDVYAGASTPVTALMAVTTKVGAFAAFIRLFMPAETAFAPVWSQGVALLAYPTLIYASFVATRQTQLRRFFAYSGIAHAGFMLLALAVNTPEAVQAMLFYLVIYGVATLGCFAVMALFDGEGEGEGMTLNSLKGLFRSSPWLAAVLAICLLTLAGIPPTVGFYAKFYLLKLAFQAGYYGLVTVALLSTILAAYFYLRLIAAMAGPIPVDSRPPQPSWPATTVAACAFGGLILLAINPQLILALL